MDQRRRRKTVVKTIQAPYVAYSGSATTKTSEPNVFFPSAMVVTQCPWAAGRDEAVGLSHGRRRRPQALR
jgi:hypothetical protein